MAGAGLFMKATTKRMVELDNPELAGWFPALKSEL
jgi:hypothetical protein